MLDALKKTPQKIRREVEDLRQIRISEAFLEFADQDATPAVTKNRFYKTTNTVATTITDFDDGYIGQMIVVEIGDANTTIDFTGTNLKGNAGVDWTPGDGDAMICFYNGSEWLCFVGDLV